MGAKGQSCGRARACSEHRVLDAANQEWAAEIDSNTSSSGATPTKGILKRRSNSTGCLPTISTAKNDDASAIEIAEAEHELKKHIERMASLLRKSKADSAVDVESQLAAQLSQMLGKIGKDEDSN